VRLDNPIELVLNIGSVIIATPGNNPDIEVRLVPKPLFLQDDIFGINYDIKKKKERKR
jgi:hypothetical protein